MTQRDRTFLIAGGNWSENCQWQFARELFSIATCCKLESSGPAECGRFSKRANYMYILPHDHQIKRPIASCMNRIIITLMKTTPLKTSDPNVALIEPDIERDARLGVQWLTGDTGRNTLQLMGVSNKNNKPTTLEYERQRVAEFIDGKDQLNWMIEHGGKVIGAVWVDLKSTDAIPGPAIHIMIGDATARGKGVGLSALESVAKYLNDNGNKTIYSRYLVKNVVAKSLLKKISFKTIGKSYFDKDDLEWQNVLLTF